MYHHKIGLQCFYLWHISALCWKYICIISKISRLLFCSSYSSKGSESFFHHGPWVTWFTVLPMVSHYSTTQQLVQWGAKKWSNAPTRRRRRLITSNHECKQCRFQIVPKICSANVLRRRSLTCCVMSYVQVQMVRYCRRYADSECICVCLCNHNICGYRESAKVWDECNSYKE